MFLTFKPLGRAKMGKSYSRVGNAVPPLPSFLIRTLVVYITERLQALACLPKITDDWYNALDNGEMVGSVFIDLKKVFHTC